MEQQQQQQQQREEHAYRRQARSLLHRLASAASPSALSSAVSELRLLSKLSPDLRSPLADSGLVPILTRLLLLDQDQDQDREDEDHLAIKENAAATLLNLSISAPEALMSCPSLLPSLSSALRRRSPPLNQLAAATLFSLLSIERYRPIIGSKQALILSPLISLLRSPNPPARTLKDALKALYAAALYPLNRPPLISLGAVPALFGIVSGDGRRGVVEDATAVVAQLAGCWESVDVFREVEGVRVLARLVEEGSGRAAENAAAAMLNMVMSGGRRAAEEVGAAEAAVRALAERGESERGRRKAAELVRAMERWRGPRPRPSFEDDGSPPAGCSDTSLASSTDWSMMRFSSSSADSSSF